MIMDEDDDGDDYMIDVSLWPDCATPDCGNKSCLRLGSPLCYPCTIQRIPELAALDQERKEGE